MPRLVRGGLNSNTEKRKDRKFVRNVLQMNPDNLVIVRNSRIADLIQRATDPLSPPRQASVRNILKALYLSKLVCSLEDAVGHVQRFEMQELDVYVEFEDSSARAAIERVLFVQNHFGRERQTVRLFSLQVGEYTQSVEASRSQAPREDWNTAQMLERVQKILQKTIKSPSPHTNAYASRRDDSLDHDENLVYLSAKLVQGLGQTDALIRETGRAVLGELLAVIQGFSVFEYLNELFFEDILDRNETVFDQVSINRNLKADRLLGQVTLVTSRVRENVYKKYYARGVTRLPLFASIYEIFAIIFDQDSHLLISSDWVKHLNLPYHEERRLSVPVPDTFGFKFKIERAPNSQVNWANQALANMTAESGSVPPPIELSLKWLRKLCAFSGVDWTKLRYFYDEVVRLSSDVSDLETDLLECQLRTLLRTSALLEPGADALNDELGAGDLKTSQVPDESKLKEETLREALCQDTLAEKSLVQANKAETDSPVRDKTPEIIRRLTRLWATQNTLTEKVICDSPKKQGTQVLFIKGLDHQMKYLFSDDDLRRLQELTLFVNRNLDDFNTLSNWDVFVAELLGLLRRPRVHNFYNDRWVKSYLLCKKDSRRHRRRKDKCRAEPSADQGPDAIVDLIRDLGFDQDDDLEVSHCPFDSHGPPSDKWHFWSVDYFTGLDSSAG